MNRVGTRAFRLRTSDNAKSLLESGFVREVGQYSAIQPIRLSTVEFRPYHVSRTNSPRFAHWRLPKLTTKLGDGRGTPRDRPPQDDAPKIIHPTCEIDRFPHRVGFTREQRPPSRRSHRLDHHPARETGGPSRLPLPRRSGCQYCRSIQ